jgi:hypothetical protein
LRLSAHLLEEPTLELPDAMPTELALGVRAKTRITEIRVSCSPSKPGT